MSRVIWKKVATGALAATAMVWVAEGSPNSLHPFTGRDANNPGENADPAELDQGDGANLPRAATHGSQARELAAAFEQE